MELSPHGNTCEVVLKGPEAIGPMRLWVPEAIMTEHGAGAVYPVGGPWRWEDGDLVQVVEPEGNFGPGNVIRVDAQTLECAGIRFPVEGPVRWRTRLRSTGDGVRFTIDLTNLGTSPLRKAGAVICLKFFEAGWWSDESVCVVSGGEVRTLKDLGRDAGRPNGFQAYLLAGAAFDNVFYREFWGFNRHILDRPLMVSDHGAAGLRVGIAAERAWFLHSNVHNPCTDVMLAFGDIVPGATARTSGEVWIREAHRPDADPAGPGAGSAREKRSVRLSHNHEIRPSRSGFQDGFVIGTTRRTGR